MKEIYLVLRAATEFVIALEQNRVGGSGFMAIFLVMATITVWLERR